MGAPGHCVETRVTSVAELEQHGGPLFQAHAQEIEPEFSDRVFPDWEFYRAAEAAGRLIVFGTWDQPPSADEQLVGYVVAAVVPNSHYRDVQVCLLDSIYLDPQWRGRRVGLRMLRLLQDTANLLGCSRMLMHAKPGSRLEKLLPVLGYTVEETLFKKDFT